MDDDDFLPQSSPHRSHRYSSNTIPAQPRQTVCYEEMKLNDKQKYALDRIVKGENVFITGSSGTGKSEMIGVIVRKLRSMNDKVVITSANLNGAIGIGGQTIQSFCGIKKLDDDWTNIKKETQLGYIKSIWNSVNVVIIDDISMLDPYEFRKILFISQNARTAKSPIQWILLGDFLTLLPHGVKPTQVREKDEMEFCFQLPEWPKLIHRTVMFTENMRHRMDDNEEKIFYDMLEDIRVGASNQVKWAAKIQQRLDQPFDKGIPFTKLYPKYESVNAENEQSLKKLSTPPVVFKAQKGYQIGNEVCPLHVPKSRQHLDKDVLKVVERLSINEYKRTKLLNYLQKHAVVEPTLTLKIGAFVILMANLNYKFGLIKGTQGVVVGFTDTYPKYPIVRFKQCECAIRSYMWTVDYSENTKMWYAQIPLKLGWAYSIHRMRGMTFSHVELSMRDMFDYGQIYDVLSKIKTLQGINFTTINWSSIKAHPLCVTYYDENQSMWNTQYTDWVRKEKVKNCDVVQYNVEKSIPKAAFHMDKLDNIRGGKGTGLKRTREQPEHSKQLKQSLASPPIKRTKGMEDEEEDEEESGNKHESDGHIESNDHRDENESHVDMSEHDNTTSEYGNERYGRGQEEEVEDQG